MLDFIYYPVSWILWFWHRVFGFAFGADNGLTWALAVVFLVFTLRLVLYKPFVKQVRTTKQMQELQPQIKELQKKYKNDRQKMALEMQKLQKENGFNPLMGCLPILAQVPVFLGLFHVLRSFNRTGHGFGQLGMDPYTNAHTPNYVFSAADVQSFLSARIFGAPISAFITTPANELLAFEDYGGIPSRISIAAVAIPLMVIASVATHFNARASVARQTPEAAANPQAALMNKLALWVFPLGVLVGGPFLPIAILLYWVSNNIWTYGQQHLVFGRMAKEEEAKKQAKLEQRAQNAPKPGAKPVDTRKKQTPAGATTTDDDTATTNGAAPVAKATGKPAGGQKRPGGQKKSGNRGRANQKRRR
ncbi:membrane protein insertase YidC [Nocardia cyriacigeorgica]|uniref:membrane protein insertase YidC n=1 Tax=Nocardia cyriacigeorgica TaxID=135487 RepID=UPI0018937B1D|nr:membrane protein insertase YidC [Nocardia cyriacigeorgica]MBF6100095.1 membrane protein insertase YidC [Nocardia cyriacigeorgica]MBF6159192.1 membrane protein insertase YidC [Nocardia cyriacigeorgica]MBF6198275.1 membrane protein insertase YidC [Nocardia cyriacigeorgica]MBF6315555.1 membrane protein insertase YidC [Nocardia cyriacigeorgica]MBF6342916.1 membrane protein insertase YidC [Nocardia cyriacigeorgica]